MTGWALFWYIVVFAAVISYFGLAVVISIGGFFDVKKMFRRLADNEPAASPPPPENLNP
jgi:hypothetical protein